MPPKEYCAASKNKRGLLTLWRSWTAAVGFSLASIIVTGFMWAVLSDGFQDWERYSNYDAKDQKDKDMVCPLCGKEVSKKDKRCPSCSAEFEPEETKKDP
jgi:hypothetical protein